MSLWCPFCVAQVTEHATRCAVCGGDLHISRADGEPGEPADAPRLAPRLAEATGPARGADPAVLLRAAGVVAAALLVVGALVGLALLGAAAGLGDVTWPALLGIGIAALLAGLLQLARRGRATATATADTKDTDTAPSDLDLAHLFAGRFAPPATHGETFLPPLAPHPVDAGEAAWRAVGATLLDLADADVVELEPRSLPTPGKPVEVLGVRLVRPLPAGDAFAARLLHPLARRGVGGSTLVSDLVAHLGLMQRQPARALLVSARADLTARGYYAASAIWPRAALRALLFAAPPPDAARIATARPALEALEARLVAWDERDPTLAPLIRHEAFAGLLRARARMR